MQWLRAVLGNSCREKKKFEHILENVRGGVLFDRVI